MTASAGDPLPAAALEPAVAPPSELNPLTHVRYAGALAGTLTRHRDLVLEMARRELSDTYAGQALGTAWALLHPILRLAIFLFLFGVVFRVDASTQPGAPPDHTVFLLSGLIPWLAFSEVLSKASSLVHANANLVKQVVFPLEVLPVKSVLAAASDWWSCSDSWPSMPVPASTPPGWPSAC